MQLYALSTGSFAAGALSMLLFVLGTVPLMFGLGLLAGALGRRFTDKAMFVGAALVVFLGLFMLSNGMTLSGVSAPSSSGAGGVASASATAEAAADATDDFVIENGVQIVRGELKRNAYPRFTVLAGMPVKWIVTAPAGSVNGCNESIVIPALDMEYTFREGENVVEFTAPQEPGIYGFSCWMGMIRSEFVVVAA